MNKTEITEIKKQYKIKDCGLERIVGRYVGIDGDIKATFNKSFLVKDEEEQHKYLNIFKKSLSGGVGKTLNTFLLDNLQRKRELIGLMRTELLEDSQEAINSFFDMVSEEVKNHSEFLGGYLMMIVSNNYDVPNKNNDGLKDGESTEVYSYIHFVLCPISPEKAGLMYDGDHNIVKRELRQIVEAPVFGFLYPSFEDRAGDYDKATVYVKKGDSLFNGVITGILGCEPSPSYLEQKSICEELIARVVEEKESGSEKVNTIKEVVQDFANRSDDGLKSFVSKEEVKTVLSKQGASSEMVDDVVGDLEKLSAAAVCTPDINVTGNGYAVKVSADRAFLFTRQEMDGKEYLMIEIPSGESITINGVEG